MNYYQDSKNGYSMNNRNDYYDNDYNTYAKDYDNNDFDSKNDYYGNKRSCCVKKVEETFCCFPSYYSEEKKEDKEDKKEFRNCWEGYFKICPKHEYYDDKKDFHNKDHNKKDECYDEKDKRENHKCSYKHNRCCGLCGLFRRW